MNIYLYTDKCVYMNISTYKCIFIYLFPSPYLLNMILQVIFHWFLYSRTSVCVCLYTFIYVYIYIYMYINVDLFIYMNICTYKHICIHPYPSPYQSNMILQVSLSGILSNISSKCIFTFIYVYIYVFMLHIYVYKYMHNHPESHTSIHIHIYNTLEHI
jgi:hypothetical protein